MTCSITSSTILFSAIIGLAAVYTELYSLPKKIFHEVSPFLLLIAKKFPSKSLANKKSLKDVYESSSQSLSMIRPNEILNIEVAK